MKFGNFGAMSAHKRRVCLVISTALCSGLAAPAFAQIVPPIHTSVDDNGVDLISGNFVTTIVEGSIGSGEGAISLSRSRFGQSNWISNWSGGLFTQTVNGSNRVYATQGTTSEAFVQSSSGYQSLSGDGSTLTNSGSTYTLTASDGTKILYDADPSMYPIQGFACTKFGNGYSSCAIPKTVTRPDGMVFTINWSFANTCPGQKVRQPDCPNGVSYYRFSGVTSSSGYGFRINYVTSNPGNYGAPQTDWFNKTSVTFLNSKGGGGSSSVSYSTPSAYYPDFTDAAGGAWHFSGGTNSALSGIQMPGSSGVNISISNQGPDGTVSSVTRNGITTNYSRSVSGNLATTTITDALSHTTTVVADLNVQRIVKFTDPLGNVTNYTFDQNGRLTQVTLPSGMSKSYTYDGYGNVTSETGSTNGVTITKSAGFAQNCSGSPVCNQPVWTKDANGNQTDYTYDSSTGHLLTVTAPTDNTGTRPQRRFGYSTILGVSLLTSISECTNSSSCTGAGNESKTSIAYNSNLLPSSVTRSSGDGAITASIAATYDDFGDAIAVDGPLPGSADTTNYTYDAMHRMTSLVSPDPDGSGPRMRRAKVMHYLPNGLADSISAGTTDANGGSFNSLQQLVSTYDGNMRKVQDTLSASGTTYAVTQYGYDAVGRLQCTAVRMDPSQWGGQSDACTPQTNGGNGPDRVTKQVYDAAGQVTGVYSALGTGAQSFEQTNYTPNGKVASVTDGNGNVTTAGYDGFDRLTTTTFPGGSYEQLTYDANGNVVSRRLRDGQVVNYGYDALNRMVSKDRPNNSYSEYDQSYSYDLVGHLTSASDTSGRVLRYDYDALGNRRAQYDNVYTFGNATFQYDAAGRRTQMTWSDGNAVTYDYLTTGEANTIRDGAGNVLATFGYDDLGRRTSLSRANGTVTSYAYDPVSRLSQLTQDLAGSANDLTVTFGYNPAGQITSRNASNDGYAWTAGVNADRSYSVNGLNQYTQAGSVALGYDGRGNLTSSGSDTYSYTVDNQMAVGKGIGMAYDPLGRLFNAAVDPNANTSFTYDGADLIAETNQNNGALLRRYIYGPGSDEPLIWYEGAGFGDRRWLHADERGSVIAVTNDAGNPIAINRYDEYGIPQSGNIGRFQYTGQKWLPALGLYDYKARTYSPTLGRFMQTDPIGYGDGRNWYNYVKSDPVNGRDPSGLFCLQVSNQNGYTTPDANGGIVYIGNTSQKACIYDQWVGGGYSYYPANGSGGYGGAGNSNAKDDKNGVTVDKSCPVGGPAYDPAVQAKALQALTLGQTAQKRNPSGPPYREYGFSGRPYFFQFYNGKGYVTSDMKSGSEVNVDINPGYFDTFDVHAHPDPLDNLGPSRQDIEGTARGSTTIVINPDKKLRCYTGK